jgi:rhodanese-related sulfurtransferase
MKDHPIVTIFLITAFISFNSCQKTQVETMSFASVDEMVSAAKSSILTINADGLMQMIEDQWRIQIVDCREPKQYTLGHIPGAINVPRGDLGFSSKLTNRRLTTLVFGNDMGSGALAAAAMKKMKYRNVTYIDCTWADWHEAYPEQMETGLGTLDVIVDKPVASGGCGE